jgi:hypothetical protein
MDLQLLSIACYHHCCHHDCHHYLIARHLSVHCIVKWNVYSTCDDRATSDTYSALLVYKSHDANAFNSRSTFDSGLSAKMTIPISEDISQTEDMMKMMKYHEGHVIIVMVCVVLIDELLILHRDQGLIYGQHCQHTNNSR